MTTRTEMYLKPGSCKTVENYKPGQNFTNVKSKPHFTNLSFRSHFRAVCQVKHVNHGKLLEHEIGPNCSSMKSGQTVGTWNRVNCWNLKSGHNVRNKLGQTVRVWNRSNCLNLKSGLPIGTWNWVELFEHQIGSNCSNMKLGQTVRTWNQDKLLEYEIGSNCWNMNSGQTVRTWNRVKLFEHVSLIELF